MCPGGGDGDRAREDARTETTCTGTGTGDGDRDCARTDDNAAGGAADHMIMRLVAHCPGCGGEFARNAAKCGGELARSACCAGCGGELARSATGALRLPPVRGARAETLSGGLELRARAGLKAKDGSGAVPPGLAERVLTGRTTTRTGCRSGDGGRGSGTCQGPRGVCQVMALGDTGAPRQTPACGSAGCGAAAHGAGGSASAMRGAGGSGGGAGTVQALPVPPLPRASGPSTSSTTWGGGGRGASGSGNGASTMARSGGSMLRGLSDAPLEALPEDSASLARASATRIISSAAPGAGAYCAGSAPGAAASAAPPVDGVPRELSARWPAACWASASRVTANTAAVAGDADSARAPFGSGARGASTTVRALPARESEGSSAQTTSPVGSSGAGAWMLLPGLRACTLLPGLRAWAWRLLPGLRGDMACRSMAARSWDPSSNSPEPRLGVLAGRRLTTGLKVCSSLNCPRRSSSRLASAASMAALRFAAHAAAFCSAAAEIGRAHV